MNRTALLLATLTSFFSLSSISAQVRAEAQTDPGCDFSVLFGGLSTPVMPQTWAVDSNGIGVVEIESVPPASGWVLETTDAGFTGAGYYRWNGGNLFSRPGSGIMTYNFLVDNPGIYAVRLHNRHNDPDPSEENDCWMSVNGSPWIKTFSNNGNNDGVWNWLLQFDPGFGGVAYSMNQGINEIRISGRSQNFQIDRLAIWATGQLGTDLSLPESEIVRDRPILGQSMTLRIADDASVFGTSGNPMFFALISSNAGPACGLSLPGFGRNGPGEFLLDPSSTIVPLLGPLSWNGTTQLRPITIPSLPTLLGTTLAAQGLFTASGAPSPRTTLTNRLRLTLGNY